MEEQGKRKGRLFVVVPIDDIPLPEFIEQLRTLEQGSAHEDFSFVRCYQVNEECLPLLHSLHPDNIRKHLPDVHICRFDSVRDIHKGLPLDSYLLSYNATDLRTRDTLRALFSRHAGVVYNADTEHAGRVIVDAGSKGYIDGTLKHRGLRNVEVTNISRPR